MDYIEAHENKDHTYTHVFFARYEGGQVIAWRESVCGFTRAGTFLANKANEDYPICPTCNRWLLLHMLGE